MQYILEPIKEIDVVDKETKEPTGERKEVIGDASFHGKLEDVFERMLEGKIRNSGVNNIEDLITEVKKARMDIITAARRIGEIR